MTNAVRGLSNVLNGAYMASYKEMHQVIKFVLDTRDLGLWIETIGLSGHPWELICFSDCAGDQDSSLAFYFIFMEYQSVGGPRLNSV